MPIYEYRCEACRKEFECLVLGSDKPECPACRSPEVCRLMSACAFYSKDGAGTTTRQSASSSGCSGCAATSCGSCGH